MRLDDWVTVLCFSVVAFHDTSHEIIFLLWTALARSIENTEFIVVPVLHRGGSPLGFLWYFYLQGGMRCDCFDALQVPLPSYACFEAYCLIQNFAPTRTLHARIIHLISSILLPPLLSRVEVSVLLLAGLFGIWCRPPCHSDVIRRYSRVIQAFAQMTVFLTFLILQMFSFSSSVGFGILLRKFLLAFFVAIQGYLQPVDIFLLLAC